MVQRKRISNSYISIRTGLSFTCGQPVQRPAKWAAAHHFELRINSNPTPDLTRDSLYNIYLNG